MNVVFRSIGFIYSPGYVAEGSTVLMYGGGRYRRFCLKKKTDTNKGKRGYIELWHPSYKASLKIAKKVSTMTEEEMDKCIDLIKKKFDIKGNLILCKEDWLADNGVRSDFQRVSQQIKSFIRLREMEAKRNK